MIIINNISSYCIIIIIIIIIISIWIINYVQTTHVQNSNLNYLICYFFIVAKKKQKILNLSKFYLEIVDGDDDGDDFN